MSDAWASSDWDRCLLEGWLRARSVARGLPQPVPDSGGLRVETAGSEEVRRYVFAGPCEGLRALGEAMYSPGIFLKLCAADEVLAAMLPSRWRIGTGRFLMSRQARRDAERALPAGYALVRTTDGPVVSIRIVTDGGVVVAAGFGASYGAFFVYDRVETDSAHQRKGLASAVMRALDECRPADAAPVLVATAEGRQLYKKIGWKVVSPYSTAFIPEIVAS